MPQPESSFTIAIAEAQPHTRRHLRQLLEGESSARVVGEAASATGTVELVRRFQPDILLLDHILQRSAEFRVKEGLTLASAEIRTVVTLTAYEKTDIVDAFRLGAHGIVLKTADRAALLESLRGVLTFRYWLGDDNVACVVEALRESLAQSHGARTTMDCGLTPREIEIIAKIAGGRSNREVSEEFRISERTVKHHLTNIFTKVGVSSRLQLALFAVNNRLTGRGDSTLLLRTAAAQRES